MKIGCLNKLTNDTEYTYHGTRFKSLPAPYGKEPYVQYEIVEKIEQYIWDENTQSVILDPNYVEPAIDYTKIGTLKVMEARAFGSQLMNEFAGENVGMGITQSGLTPNVLAVMEEQVEFDPINKAGIKISVMGTISSGSLYETTKVIDYHIAQANLGNYDNLAPFITSTRLTEFKGKIMGFLLS